MALMEALRIPVGDGAVTGRLTGTGIEGILLAHGAGTDQDHPFMALLRDALAAAGLTVLTFNYAYTERGSRRPDSTDRLLDCHRAAADTLAGRVERVFLAGRSMGGRIGLYLAAEGWPAAGVVLFAYPLHPAGKPEKLRIDRFADVVAPMLFFQGTRDALARTDLFDRHVRPLANARVEMLPGATHSTRGGGWTDQSMAEHLAARTVAWMDSLGAR